MVKLRITVTSRDWGVVTGRDAKTGMLLAKVLVTESNSGILQVIKVLREKVIEC